MQCTQVADTDDADADLSLSNHRVIPRREDFTNSMK
jgi:hypothetical protein